ncbi:protein phosphatase Slingshot homolog 1-like [Patiria miniata]|uniref:protein-tyrosine-phosphatase n=1 Tax=Patiria miniata TaxID=46514 RepID=A0A913ZAS3_PATMI|nr:protein phosphatase Slingshot homolog 1-like [Patiria miniata]XP_038048873.1 protein phosphatase Slingshot homolog 1-like [Patiria miniata]
MLSGGFTAFKTAFPYLCEPQGQAQCTMLGPTLSQPCLPVAKVGPTRVLNYLYIGSQQDVLDEDIMRANGINYVLNVSKTCPSPTHIAPGHFHRIPVRDNYGEKLLPWFEDAMDFIEKVRSANGCVIVHCLAGISRSPTVAIAYIMKHMNLTVDEAYKYVKEKRQTISPNFNFLGQLLEFEKRLHLDHPPKGMPAEPSTTATASAATPTRSQPTSVSSNSKSVSCKNQSEVLSSSSQPNPTVRVTKPGAPFPEPILLTEDTQAVAEEPSTPTSAEHRTHKRSISEQKEGELPAPPPARSPNFRIRTIPRPRGLDVKVSKIGPIFLGSPPSSESKKPRSGNSSPCGLLEQLAWGTSHLSVNSPEVRQKNPFVEACARLAEKRLQEEVESRVRDEAKAVQQSNNAEVTSTITNTPSIPQEMPSKPKPQEPVVILETKKPEPQTAKTEPQLQVTSATEPSTISNPSITGSPTMLILPKKEDPRKSVEVKRRGILKNDGKGKVKGRSKSPRTVSPRPMQMAVKQTLTGKSQVTVKSTCREAAHAKVKKATSPSETSVGFQFGRTRVGKFMDAVLPNSGTKCKTSKAKNKEYPQLMVAKQVHVQLETPRHASIESKSPSPKDPLNPFFARQISSHSQNSDTSSGISPSCDSEPGSIGLNSPSSSGISPDYTGPSPNLFDSLGNLVRSPLLTEVKSCPTFSTISETEVGSHAPVQRSHTVTPATEECKTNVWQKRKECGNSFEEPAFRPDPSPLDRLGGYAPKRGQVVADHTDCERSDTRCSSRRTPMVVAGRSASCEEISSCAREAVSEIVVRPRREIIDLSSYGAGMDGEEDDYDSRSLSSQRSLSSSCEMIEVS